MINLLVKASINAYSCIATKLFTNYCVHIFLIFQTIITNFKSDCTDTHVVLINSAGFLGWGTGEKSLISIVFQKITWDTQFADGSNKGHWTTSSLIQ